MSYLTNSLYICENPASVTSPISRSIKSLCNSITRESLSIKVSLTKNQILKRISRISALVYLTRNKEKMTRLRPRLKLVPGLAEVDG